MHRKLTFSPNSWVYQNRNYKKGYELEGHEPWVQLFFMLIWRFCVSFFFFFFCSAAQ